MLMHVTAREVDGEEVGEPEVAGGAEAAAAVEGRGSEKLMRGLFVLYSVIG